MGSLITELPVSENGAMLEILGLHGVTREDIARFRAAPRELQAHLAEIISSIDYIGSISTTSSKRGKCVTFGDTLSVPERGHFVASMWYRITTDDPVPIAYMSDVFTKWVWPTIEASIPARTLRYMELKMPEWRPSEVFFDLGGRKKAMISLGEFYEVLRDLGEKKDFDYGHGIACFIASENGTPVMVMAARSKSGLPGWSIATDAVNRTVRGTHYRFVTPV